MKSINLTKGYCTLVDDEDFDFLNRFKWYADVKPNGVYPSRKINNNGFWTSTRMHNQIIEAPEGFVIDHKDRNPLNNQKINLRIATLASNSQNRSKSKSRLTSKYLGVHFDKGTKKWRSQLKVSGRRIECGYHDNEIEAAKAYNEFAKIYFGEFANLNIIKEPVICHSVKNIIEPSTTLN